VFVPGSPSSEKGGGSPHGWTTRGKQPPPHANERQGHHKWVLEWRTSLGWVVLPNKRVRRRPWNGLRNREMPRGGEQRTEETQNKHDEVAMLDTSKIPNHCIRDPNHHGLRSPCGSTLLALTSFDRNRAVFAPKKYVPLQCKLTRSGGTFVKEHLGHRAWTTGKAKNNRGHRTNEMVFHEPISFDFLLRRLSVIRV